MSSAAIDISKTDELCVYRHGATQCYNVSDMFSRNMIDILPILYFQQKT